MTSNTPLISTIIPTYRRPHTLKKAIESVLNQTFPHLQVLVFDDLSGDETEQVVRELQAKDPRVHFYPNPVRLGSAGNFQRGIRAVQTPFFSLLSDDDLLLPDFYERALAALAKHPEALLFVGGVMMINQRGVVVHEETKGWPDQELFEPPEGLYRMVTDYVNWTGSLFRKEAASVFSLREGVEAIDYDFMTQLTARFPFVFSKKPCALFRVHSGCYSALCGTRLFWPGWPLMREDLMRSSELPLEVREKVGVLMEATLFRKLMRLVPKMCLLKQLDELEVVVKLLEEQFGQRVWLVRGARLVVGLARWRLGLFALHKACVGLLWMREWYYRKRYAKAGFFEYFS